MDGYDPKVTPWQIKSQDFPWEAGERERQEFLLRYALLAPSTRNTQPWKFALEGDRIQIFLDPSRWQPVADHDQREMYISIGCALENLIIAAEHFGYGTYVQYCPSPLNAHLAAVIGLTPGGDPSPFRPPALFDMLTHRCTNHKAYDPQPVPAEDLATLQAVCVEEELLLLLTDDTQIKQKVHGLIVRADAIQFADLEFREELGHWVGQGVFGTSWLLSILGQMAYTHLNQGAAAARRDSEILLSAPTLAVLCARTNDRTAQIKCGQAFERICLTATMLDLGIQPMSQIVEVAETQLELARILPIEHAFALHPFRLGYAAPEGVHTPRRLLEDMLL
jgi:nitroreductase